MSRLVIEAVRNELILGSNDGAAGALRFYVSVSQVETGRPVTKLTAANFRVATPSNVSAALKVLVSETKWPGAEKEHAGFYNVAITGNTGALSFEKGINYAFGIQVRRFRGGEAVDFGQAVVSVMGAGHTVFALPETDKG